MQGDWHDLGGALADDASGACRTSSRSLTLTMTPSTRLQAAEWIAAILNREKISVTPDVKDHLWSALSSLASAPTGERTLMNLSSCSSRKPWKRSASAVASAVPLAGCWMPASG